MGRKIHCTNEERRVAKNLRSEGKTIDFIARALGRSEHCIRNALKWEKTNETRGRPRKTSSTTDSRIVLLAKKTHLYHQNQFLLKLIMKLVLRQFAED